MEKHSNTYIALATIYREVSNVVHRSTKVEWLLIGCIVGLVLSGVRYTFTWGNTTLVLEYGLYELFLTSVVLLVCSPIRKAYLWLRRTFLRYKALTLYLKLERELAALNTRAVSK